MDSFEALGYELYKNTEEKIIYSKYLGDTKFSIELNKKTEKIEKFANDFRKIVEILPDAEDIAALKAYLENKTKK